MTLRSLHMNKLVDGNRPSHFLPILTNGLVAGLLEIVVVVSFGALVFSGGLSPSMGHGIGLTLLAAAINLAFIALLTSLPGTIGGSQDLPAVIFAGVAASIAQSLAGSAPSEEIFFTVVAAIGITTMATGACLLALGHYRLGRLVRFLPYPVMGGMLAGTGWLLSVGAISTMTDAPLGLSLFQGDELLRWLPGALFAVALLWSYERSAHAMLIPGMVLGGVLLFHTVMLMAGIDVAEMSAQGWLLGPFEEGSLWRDWSLGDLAQVHWWTIVEQGATLATIPVLSAVALLLNATGLEVAVERDVDLDRELKSAGVANLFTGAAGGYIGFQELAISAMNYRVGATSRWTGLVAALVCVAALFEGAPLMSLFPRAVLGGLLMFLGLSFLFEWVWRSRLTLPRSDYAVVIVILLSTALLGFLEAVAIGLALAAVLFVVHYSRVDVLRQTLSGANFHSRVIRAPSQREALRKLGDAICVLRLQGYLFFGTATRLLEQVRRRLNASDLPAMRFAVLDFHHVTGVDTTITLTFKKLSKLTEPRQITLVVTGASATVIAQLARAGLREGEGYHLLSNLDSGLEWCESQLLDDTPEIQARQDADMPVREVLANMLSHPNLVECLLNYLQREDLMAGQRLMRRGESPDNLYVLISGQLTAQHEQTDAPGREPLRLSTQRGAQVVGEIGFYLGQPRSADVIADEPSVVYRLSAEALRRMELHDPQLASELHRLIVRQLAGRVTHLTDAVSALAR